MGFDVSYTGPAPTRNCASRRWPTSVTSAVLCLMRAHATAKHESSTGSTRGAFLFTTHHSLTCMAACSRRHGNPIGTVCDAADHDHVSKTGRWKMLGNSFSVPVVAHILKGLQSGKLYAHMHRECTY